jgi:hypothetical protein
MKIAQFLCGALGNKNFVRDVNDAILPTFSKMGKPARRLSAAADEAGRPLKLPKQRHEEYGKHVYFIIEYLLKPTGWYCILVGGPGNTFPHFPDVQ